MITRAIITEVDLSISKVKVRIPLLENMATRNKNSTLSDYGYGWASILYTPGIDVDYRVGDVVIIGFEDNNIGLPIVLGFLKLRDRDIDSRIYGTFKSLDVEESFRSSTDTVIGITTYQELFDVVDGKRGGSEPGSPETYSAPILSVERGTDGTASLRIGNTEVSLEDVQLFEVSSDDNVANISVTQGATSEEDIPTVSINDQDLIIE